MKRFAKILPKESLIPELRYLLFSEHGLTAWNGSIGLRFDMSKLGTRLPDLITEYERFAVLDGTKFLRIMGVLDKITDVQMDRTNNQMIITGGGGKSVVKIPVLLNIPNQVPHLAIPWVSDSSETVSMSAVWDDCQDLITGEGVTLWGDAVGIYDSSEFTASFDYAVLLYKSKQNGKNKTGGRKAFQRIPKVNGDIKFCPYALTSLGLNGLNGVVFDDHSLFLVGDGIQYYTTPITSTQVLVQMLEIRTSAMAGKVHSVSLDFGTSLWKRAKVFGKAIVTLSFRGGVMILSAGGSQWEEQVGITDAPDCTFVTRVSLLQKWISGTLGHKISIKDDEWYLTGITRKGSEFYASLTSIARDRVEDIMDIAPEEDLELGENLLM